MSSNTGNWWQTAEKAGLLVLATLLRAAVAAALKWLPYKMWQPLVLCAMRERPAINCDQAVVDRVVSAVQETERFLPVGRCLERALTAWLLLRRKSDCRLRLGAGLDADGKPYAHAWLEAQGEVLFGAYSNKLSYLEIPPDPPASSARGNSGGEKWW